MPLEIRQVVIRAEVDPEAKRASGGAGARGDRRAAAQQEDFVQEIVDQVMQMIEDRKAR